MSDLSHASDQAIASQHIMRLLKQLPIERVKVVRDFANRLYYARIREREVVANSAQTNGQRSQEIAVCDERADYLEWASKQLGTTPEAIKARVRPKILDDKRHVILESMRQALNLGLVEAARGVGRTHHGTALNSRRVVAASVVLQKACAELVEKWRARK